MLDHETKPRLTVIVTATDPYGATDTATVTVNVTDVDEAPMAVGSNDRTVEYTENDTSSVVALSARDPEGAAPIVWSILDGLDGQDVVVAGDISDNAHFKISQDGVLTFATKPDYDAEAADGDNAYKVTVQASDGNMPSYFKVTVNVQDLEEEGSVKLQPTNQTVATLLQPQVGVSITPHTLTDPDGNSTADRDNSAIAETDATWQWYRSSSSSKTATRTAITTTTQNSRGTERAYTPVAADVDLYLHVEATYDDGRGAGKIAQAVSEYKTISEITTNKPPVFPTTPIIWVVLEGTDAGTSIGSPVTATDDDGGEELTYWLSAGTADNDKFNIDAKTGQLEVKENLNYETPESDDGTMECTNDSCEVTVNAADSSGTATTMVTVTINVINVDEKPTFGPGPTTITRTRVEGMTALTDATFMATDPEEGSVTLSLSGADASKFDLNDPDPVAAGSKVLAFKDEPDFEMPGDSNRDNVYQVTVVASDGVNSAMRHVIVKVTDLAEDGMIEVAPSQPRVGTALTATVTDPDGVISPTWKWRKLMEETTTCPLQNAPAWTPTDAPGTTLIEDAESATYTPVSGDEGSCLRVEANYLDMNYDSAVGSFAKNLDIVAGKVQGPSTNVAPMFDGTTAMRYVPENSAMGVYVGSPVVAEDNDELIYTLSGADAGLFAIAADDDTTDVDESKGQIQVKTANTLDHETKPTLTVTVNGD